MEDLLIYNNRLPSSHGIGNIARKMICGEMWEKLQSDTLQNPKK